MRRGHGADRGHRPCDAPSVDRSCSSRRRGRFAAAPAPTDGPGVLDRAGAGRRRLARSRSTELAAPGQPAASTPRTAAQPPPDARPRARTRCRSCCSGPRPCSASASCSPGSASPAAVSPPAPDGTGSRLRVVRAGSCRTSPTAATPTTTRSPSPPMPRATRPGPSSRPPAPCSPPAPTAPPSTPTCARSAPRCPPSRPRPGRATSG